MNRPVSNLLWIASAAVALLSIGLGLWAMLAPESFYANVAPYPPYSRHLVHDLGAFQLGVGSCLWFALFVRDALLAALSGAAVGAIAHFVSHLADRALGGHPTDPASIGLLALVLLLLTAAQARRAVAARAVHKETVQ